MIDVGLLLLGVLVVVPAGLLAPRAAARAGLDRSVGGDLAWAGGVGFVLAGRVTWLALNPGALTYPIDVIRITQGIVTAAGVLGAVAGVLWVARRRGLVPARLIGPATVIALVGAAGWQAACPVQDRCGGVDAPIPLGLPLGGPEPQVPLGPLLAVVAVGLVFWVWRGLRVAAPVARPVAALGIVLLTVGVTSAWRLRIAPWPTLGDLALIAEGILALVVAARWRPAESYGPQT